MILDTLLDHEDTPQMPFSPIGSREGYIETYSTSNVNAFNDILQSIDEERVERRSPEGREISGLNFYCLRIDVDEENGGDIYVFRRVNKFNKLTKKGFFGSFTAGDFNQIDSEIVGIDNNIDLIVYNGEILILNHIGLERVFSISSQYQEKATETLNMVERSERIENFERFRKMP